jgi:hypothetical protein
MPTNLEEIRPFKSLLLASVKQGGALQTHVDAVVDDTLTMLAARDRVTVQHREPARTTDGLTVGFVHYRETRRAAWTADERISDTFNHLVVVCRRHRQVAIYASDSRFRSAMSRRFRDSESLPGLGTLEEIDPLLLNAVFVRGPTRTLWLSGMHRRTSVKADTKVLSGVDLRDALDPLGDQSYYFSAARSQVKIGGVPVGVTPRKSSIWAGTTSAWTEFRDFVVRLLGELESAVGREEAPLPVLAIPEIKASILGEAYEVGLQPPELLADDPSIGAEERQEMERWAFKARFEIVDSTGSGLTAEVFLDDERLGTLVFEVEASNPARVAWSVTGTPASAAVAEELAAAQQHCEKASWLTVRYDSGHAVSDGAVFKTRFRDLPFRGFVWVDLAGFEVGREKPGKLDAIGTDTSLFDWVQRNWPNVDGTGGMPGGWLACDDGAMEIADFIHLDENTSPPTLALIHVKASNSSRPERKISVAPYEVVVAQAVKNLRHLDSELLAEGLRSGMSHRVGKLVWHDRERSDRAQMLSALGALGTNYQRRLVVFQPQVTKARHDAARSGGETLEFRRLQQLDSLLLGADADAHALGAPFTVLAEG